MNSSAFDILLNLVGPTICKMDTVMRPNITSSEILIATLKFLATGNSYEDMKFSIYIFTSSLSHIIPETYKALYEVLALQYLKVNYFILSYLNLTKINNYEKLYKIYNQFKQKKYVGTT